MSSLLAQGPAQIEVPAIDYAALLPLLIILAAACIAVLVEAFLPRHQRWPVQVGLSVAALGLAGLALGLYAGGEPAGLTTIGDALAVDRPTLFLWGTLLALGLGSVLLIADRSFTPGYNTKRRPTAPSPLGRCDSCPPRSDRRRQAGWHSARADEVQGLQS